MTIQLLIDSKFNSAGVKEAEAKVQRLAKFIEQEMSTTSGGSDFFVNQMNAVNDPGTLAAIEQQIAKVDALATAFKNAAIQQYSLGNISVAEGIQKQGEALERTAESMRKLTGATEQQNNEQQKSGGILDIVNNKWTKFSFALFVAQGTVNTITRLIKGMFDTLMHGAEVADRAGAFNVLLEDAGYNAANLAGKLREAGQGALTMDAAMRPTLQLIKAGVPDIAGMSDELLKIATSSAILSGDLSQVDNIYTTLVRGIVRGSPRLIDNADIYLKLGDAVETYAASINKSVEELTPEDKIRATAQAVSEQGQSIVELAEIVDSSALVFQGYKTDLEEAGNMVGGFFSKSVATAITSLQQLTTIYFTTRAAAQGFSAESQKAVFDLTQSLVKSPLTTILGTIAIGFVKLKGVVAGIIAEIKNFFSDLGMVFDHAGKKFDLLMQRFRGEITTEEMQAQMNALTAEYQANLKETGAWTAEMDKANEEARTLAISLGLLPPELEDATDAMGNSSQEAQRLSSSFNSLSAGIQAAIEARTGLDAQYRDRKIDIEEGLREKILDINKDTAEKLGDISTDLRDKLIEIGEKYQEDVTKLAEDTAEKLQDIDTDLAEKLADITESSQDDRANAIKNRNKGIEDAEEDHQRKLTDIERKYEASRMKALIDRDARALFEAEQSRKDDIASADEDLQDKLKDEEEKLQEQIDKINELEEKRRQDAIDAAEKRRQDALKSQAEQLDDLKKALAKQKEEENKNAAEKRRDALQDAQERRQDAQDGYRDSLQDLDEWYREQQLRQKEANLQQKLNELQHLEEMGELTQAHLDELRGMWNDYNGFVSNAGGSSGGGGSYGSPSTGGGGGASSGTPGIGVGGGTGAGVGNNSQINQWQQNNMKLQINSNDKMLEDVLRSSTYDYMIEVVQ